MPPRQQDLRHSFGVSSTSSKEKRTHSRCPSKRQRIDSFVDRGDGSRFGACPLCNARFPMHVLAAHAQDCNGPSSPSAKGPEKRIDPHADRSRFGECPLCNVSFPMHILTPHAENCSGPNNDVANSGATHAGMSVTPMGSKHSNGDDRSEGGLDNFRQGDCPGEKSSTVSEKKSEESTTPWWEMARGLPRIPNPIQPTDEPLPGLFLFDNFITEQEEAMILAELDGTCSKHQQEFLPWKQAKFNGSNKGKRWGVHCNLRDRRVSAPEHPMPHFFHLILLDKLKRVVAMGGGVPNEANAIDYRRKLGHWLQSHVDDRQLSKEPIANLSIAGDCYMTFQNEKVPEEARRVLLRRRTLQVLTGKARYDYSHGIRNQDLLTERRVSITMRESPLTKK